jgi:hypothetical protein
VTSNKFMLSSHLHGGVVVDRGRTIDDPPVRPIRTVCAWCASHDRPAAVLVDVPIDDRGLSHGICAACRTLLRSNTWSCAPRANRSQM